MTLDLSKFKRCEQPCSKGTLWQRLQDWMLPRYTVGVDTADGVEVAATVLMRRNGCLEIVSISRTPVTGEKAEREGGL